jgi:hypothetical protein
MKDRKRYKKLNAQNFERPGYSGIRVAVPLKHRRPVAFSVRGPQRQVLVAEVEEKATFKTYCMGMFTLIPLQSSAGFADPRGPTL